MDWFEKFTANGTTALCCIEERTDDSTLAKNFINGKWETVNFMNHSIKDVINCGFYKKLRKQILNGEIPDPCIRCINQEKHTGSSLRTYRNNEN